MLGGAVDQEAYRRSLARDAASSAARIRALDAELDGPALRWRPPDGGWSTGQVFEHLCVTDDSYLGRLAPLIRSGDAPRSTGRGWKPSLLGGLLVRSLRPASTRRLPAPRIYRPAAEPRPGVIGEYLHRQEEVARLLEEAAALDWRRVRLASPVAALVRLNLGDAFTILVVHAQRHLEQVERVRRAMWAEMGRRGTPPRA